MMIRKILIDCANEKNGISSIGKLFKKKYRSIVRQSENIAADSVTAALDKLLDWGLGGRRERKVEV